MKRAVLLPNITGFPSESMRRYAAELVAALRGLKDENWEIDEIVCEPSAAVSAAFGGGKTGGKMASRHARLIKYQGLIRARAGSIFHILDHSHANLALSTPPEVTVLTCHDIIPLLTAKGLVSMPYPALTRLTFPLRVLCMKRCHKIIAISESTKKR